MDLFEARGNWTPLSVLLLAFYAALPEDLSQRRIKFKELRSYISHHLLVGNESTGSQTSSVTCPSYLWHLHLQKESIYGGKNVGILSPNDYTQL